MRQLRVPSGVEEYQLQSAVANICPKIDDDDDDDDSGVDGDYDRSSDHRSNAISRCKYMSQLWATASTGPTIVQAGAC